MLSKKNTHIAISIILLWTIIAQTWYAAGIVEVGGRGPIESIIDFASSWNLLNITRNILYDLLDFARLVLNGVALLAMLYVWFLWVTSMGDEEKQSDGKNRIMLVVLGLFIINIPEVIYRIITGSNFTSVWFGRKISEAGGQLSTGNTATSIAESGVEKCNFFFCPTSFWWSNIDAIIPFLEVTMLVVAVVMFTIWGFSMLLWGTESASETAKRRLWYGVIALLITGFLEMLYRALFFQSNLGGIAKGIVSVLIKWAKFFIFLAGPVAIIYIIIGGYYFITSWGDEERADRGKKILMYTFFATLMLLLGYTFLIEIIGIALF